MTVVINGTTGIDKVQDGSIVAADLASGVALSNIGTGGITADYLASSAQPYSFKNRIINGAMMIDQRNAGAAITSTGYPVDRFQVYQQVSSKLSAQQNGGGVTPPAGFSKYLGITSSSSYSVGSTEFFFLWQAIEGYNVADLAWGTANAVAVTLSFKVYSSKTGTFGGSIQNGAQDRSYPFTYTVSSANTWTSVSVTIPGDTSGTWLTTNGSGMQINFDMGSGSTRVGAAGAWASAFYVGATGSQSIVATSGATFYITGVQLEKGSTATSFDYRPYGTELQLCYRYYYYASGRAYQWRGYAVSGANVGTYATFPVTPRTLPTVTPVNTTSTGSAVSTAVYGTHGVVVVSTGGSTGDNYFFGDYIMSAEL